MAGAVQQGAEGGVVLDFQVSAVGIGHLARRSGEPFRDAQLCNRTAALDDVAGLGCAGDVRHAIAHLQADGMAARSLAVEIKRRNRRCADGFVHGDQSDRSKSSRSVMPSPMAEPEGSLSAMNSSRLPAGCRLMDSTR